ncbi:hypothetical protein MPSEU_000758600 [Mayamaea pseudoterrestris]|nr:hypothetical protein MPSEU_000758600 [Mayamaea pseudoterrestris]
MMRTISLLVVLIAAAAVSPAAGQEICTSSTNEFHAHVNLHAGELGYFYFDECGNQTNPTIGLELNQVYTFYQTDRSNYMHPLGLAYFPDGAHVDKNELEPVVSEGTSGCDETASCPSPMYFVDGKYQGTYSNIAGVLDVTQNQDNFGLDAYEPLFYHPVPEWAGKEFSVQLNFSDTTYTKDIFYFCHIHSHMSGRIKLLSNGEPISAQDTPEIEYSYDQPSEYDQTCGTYNLSSYQLPNDQCQVSYLCDIAQDNPTIQKYSDCLNSMNCAMHRGMTTAASANDAVALFVHQMIPHHQNAINMAKALLNLNVLDCTDLTNEDSDDCILEGILRHIVNAQNMEIQVMRAYLEAKGLAPEDDCKIELSSTMEGMNHGGSDSGAAAAFIVSSTWLALAGVALFL